MVKELALIDLFDEVDKLSECGFKEGKIGKIKKLL